MKIVREDYNETVKNISAFCFFTHDDIDNLEYLSKCENRDRMLELFGYIEFNYDQFHKHDLKNKSYYMLKAASIVRDFGPLLNNMSCNCLSLLVTEFPFELDTENNIDRFKALASDELLSEVRLLSNRFDPVDVVCTFLQHFDKNRHKITNEESLQKFRDNEVELLIENKKKYFLTHLTTENYIEKIKMEGRNRNEYR